MIEVVSLTGWRDRRRNRELRRQLMPFKNSLLRKSKDDLRHNGGVDNPLEDLIKLQFIEEVLSEA